MPKLNTSCPLDWMDEKKKPRNPEIKRQNWLFIDLGSYRTTVLCWPVEEDVFNVSALSRYLIRYRTVLGEEEDGFPSAFTREGRPFEFLRDSDFSDHKETDYISSAKYFFASEYTKNQGIVLEFKRYIREVIRATLERISAPDPASPWNDVGVPVINGIRVTVPDLFIENLRQGYCKSIKEVCIELCREDERWLYLLQEENTRKDSFVQVSTDENGAGELYFIKLLQHLPFLNLSCEDDNMVNLEDVRYFFSHTGASIAAGAVQPSPDTMDIACCRIDIGGLTTDASAALLRIISMDIESEIKAGLIEKDSFSENEAGEQKKKEYEKFSRKKGIKGVEWWESQEFLEHESGMFLRRIIDAQYASILEWKKKHPIESIYFILSGRPTQAKPIQEMLTRMILRRFNQDDLLLMKEHCLFMSDYPHIWRDGILKNARQYEGLAKLVTVIGNLFTLESSSYDVLIDKMQYHIRVDLGRKSKAAAYLIPSGTDGNKCNLSEYPLFQARVKNATIPLSFSKHPSKNFRKFLIVTGPLDDAKLYPSLTTGKHTESWILPGLFVSNLETPQGKERFRLCWHLN